MKHTTITKFLQKTEMIRKDIYEAELDHIKEEGIYWSYVIISANLSIFLPQIKQREHFKIIQNLQYHRSLSGLELLYPSLVNRTKINDPFNLLKGINNKGKIFVGYHIGPYNLFLSYLAQKKIPFCLVTNKEYISEHEKTVQEIYKKINKNESLQFFSSDDPKLLFKLIKKLKNGVSVFLYIDGNSGIKKNTFSKDKNLLKVNFLEHHIYARKGVAYLAYLSKSPIVSVISRRGEKLKYEITLKPINTENLLTKYNRNDFINRVTKEIYKELEKFLEKNFEQWSGWFHLQNFFDTKELIKYKRKKTNVKKNRYKLNELIHLIKYDDKNIFLVMKKNYEILKIEKQLYDVLNLFIEPKKIIPNRSLFINNYNVSWNFIKELIEIEYLIAV